MQFCAHTISYYHMIPQHSSHRPKGRQACWFLGSAVVLESKETLLSNRCQRGKWNPLDQKRHFSHGVASSIDPTFAGHSWFLHQRNHRRNVLIDAKLLFHAPLPEIWKELKKSTPFWSFWILVEAYSKKPPSRNECEVPLPSPSCTLPIQTAVMTEQSSEVLPNSLS